MKRLIIIALLLALLAAAIYFFLFRKKPETARTPLQDLILLIPKDVTAIAYIDFTVLRESPFWKKTVALMPPEKRDEEFNRFVAETGFDYERDLDRMVLAQLTSSAAQSLQLAIGEGRFNRERIRAYALRNGKGETRDGVETFRFDARGRAPVAFAFFNQARVLLAQSSSGGEAFVRSFLRSPPSDQPFEEKMHQHLAGVAGASALVVARIQPTPRGKSASGNFLDQLQDLRGSIDWLTFAARPEGDHLKIQVEAESDGAWKAMQLGILLDGFKLLAKSALKNPQSDTGLSRNENEALLRLLDNATTSRDGHRLQLRFELTPDLARLFFEKGRNGQASKNERPSPRLQPH